MTDSTNTFSVIEYYGEQRKSKCGYCKQSDSSHSHGMWAHCLTNQDYQYLIDRGWRRSGKYCYKPRNDDTCCPCYTIKCNVSTFTLSKSHKKIIKKVNKFLVDGIADKDDASNTQQQQAEKLSMDCSSHQMVLPSPKKKFDLSMVKDIVMEANNDEKGDGPSKVNNDSKSNISAINALSSGNHGSDECNSGNKVSDECNSGNKVSDECRSSRKSNSVGADPSKPLRKKAKVLRMERRAQKLTQSTEDIPKKPPKNLEKNLETLLNEVQTNSRHRLEVKLLTSTQSNDCTEVFNLYRKYQIAVHNDPPSKLKKSSFEGFLVKLVPVAANEQKLCTEELSLFQMYQTVIHNDDEPDANEFVEFLITSPLELEQFFGAPTLGYGSFHQQYWLDEKLIAVGVIDILPSCVSSVYFFYDPDYSFLSLGTYGSLREIHLVQQLQQQVNTIGSYYMGYYIHSCPKMRYKGKLHSSYLLCPETYTWHLLDDRIIQALNESKYQRLNNDLLAQDVNQFTIDDLDDMLILHGMRIYMTFRQYAQRYAVSVQREDFLEYGTLVGKILSKRLMMLQ